MASQRGAYVLNNKDQCWGSGLYCTLYARTSFWHCSSCGVEAYINKSSSECAVCQFQKLEFANPGWGCQCTNMSDEGNRKLILEARAAQRRANITQNSAGYYIGLPQTVSGPIRAAWDQQEAELWAQQRPATDQSSAAQPAQPPQPQLLKEGKLHLLSTGEWYVHCKWCETETRLEARNEEEAIAMLEEWRLSMRGKKYNCRNWSCPKCVDEYWKERDQRRSDTAGSAVTDTAGSAGQLADAADAAATPFDDPEVEVAALKAENVELKAKIERLKAEVVELKYEETSVREIAESVMRAIAEETEECAESLRVYSVEVFGPCAAFEILADNMHEDSIRLRNLSSRLHQLLRQLGWDAPLLHQQGFSQDDSCTASAEHA